MNSTYVRIVDFNGKDMYQLVRDEEVISQTASIAAVMAAWKLLDPETYPIFSDN